MQAVPGLGCASLTEEPPAAHPTESSTGQTGVSITLLLIIVLISTGPTVQCQQIPDALINVSTITGRPLAVGGG